ncbi:MAG: hypothetical protein RLZZ573_388, partial [Pseudomonadota bacterium]
KPDKANTIQTYIKPGTTQEAAVANVAFDGVTGNAVTAMAFRKGNFGAIDINEGIRVLREASTRVHDGKLQDLETTLTAQASTLDAIFNELARRSALNLGEYIGAAETYLRLALKAQSQCRATIETIAAMKNPPVVFTRNANIVNGPQQINNHQPQTNSLNGKNSDSPAREELEHHHANTLDTGAQAAPERVNSTLEAVEQVHRPAKRHRKG